MRLKVDQFEIDIKFKKTGCDQKTLEKAKTVNAKLSKAPPIYAR